MPVTAVALRFCTVILMVDAVPRVTVAGLKLLLTSKGCSTVKVPLAEAPVGALAELMRPVLLTNAPAVAACTLTVTTHEPLAGIVAPVSVREVPPLAALTEPPGQLVLPAGVAVLVSGIELTLG